MNNSLDKYLIISLHTEEWGEMSLLQQVELHNQAITVLAELRAALETQRNLIKSNLIVMESAKAALDAARKVIDKYNHFYFNNGGTELREIYCGAAAWSEKYPASPKE